MTAFTHDDSRSTKRTRRHAFGFSLKYLLTHSSNNTTVCTDVLIAHYIIYIQASFALCVLASYTLWSVGHLGSPHAGRGVLLLRANNAPCYYCAEPSHKTRDCGLLNAGAANTWATKPNTATSSTRTRMRARDAVLHSTATTAKQVIRQMVFSA